VAPGVTFGAYRVVGCGNYGSTDVILAGLGRAYRDGADVVNMSLAENYAGWPGNPVARASSRLVDKGVVVAAAAGNSGVLGAFGASSPSVGQGVISVASVENLKQAVPGFTVSPDQRPIQYVAGNAPSPVPTAGTIELARTGTVNTPDGGSPPRLLRGSAAARVSVDEAPSADRRRRPAADHAALADIRIEERPPQQLVCDDHSRDVPGQELAQSQEVSDEELPFGRPRWAPARPKSDARPHFRGSIRSGPRGV
jgi:hypothetical protein